MLFRMLFRILFRILFIILISLLHIRYIEKFTVKQNILTPFLDLDRFINIKKLKQLNRYLEKIDFTQYNYINFNANKKKHANALYLTDRINWKKNYGFREHRKYLSDSFYWKKNKNWYNLHRLSRFIKQLPFFESVGKITIIFNEPNIPGSAHCDHKFPNLVSEFIWLRTNKKKQFYVSSNKTKQNFYVNGYCGWFDDHHMHNITPINQKCFSIRIDGKFNSYFRNYISKFGVFYKDEYRNILKNQ